MVVTVLFCSSFLLQFQLTVIVFMSCACQFYRHREQFYNQFHPGETVMLLEESICPFPAICSHTLSGSSAGTCVTLGELDQVLGLPENKLLGGWVSK